ncbi:MAG TPA: 4-(cytidine 5'-diphospho)-2-C-methyl-D-erythritol kinase [Oscillospiraceae bacterium]|nr:4-(cytidine 5'-diphospho)-2-C-methyl-D-erythritol kinase [Oscillospiraceae bacterium]
MLASNSNDSEKITCNTYAKINLTLDIIGKRADGYHLLQMVMQSVSLCDTVTLFKKSSGGVLFACSHPDIPCDERNTVVKAANAFFHYCNITEANVTIELIKRIPSQAGLAGGSADAAAVLHTLNQMYQTNLSKEQLCEIGLTVGADVPFCVCGGTMLAEGTGEILTPLSPMPHCYLVLCKPLVNVNTAQAYALSDRADVSAHPNTEAMCKAIGENDLNAICANLSNVFEQVLTLPQVDEVKHQMNAMGALGSCMTGSGSVVFGIFQDEISAQNCKQELQKNYREVFVCEPQNPG